MKHFFSKNSEWFTIWVAPRATMRRILDTNPTRYVYWLAMVGGVAQALNQASMRDLGDTVSIPMLVLIVLCAGILVGFATLYVGSPLMRWTGSWMGSTATTQEVRAALAWSEVPLIWASLLWIPELLLWGTEWFTEETPRMEAAFENGSVEGVLLAGLVVVEIVVGIWALIISLKCVGEAERFSAWKVVGQWFLTLFVLIISLVVLGAITFFIVRSLGV